jgi:hypothetical protein
MIVAKIATRKLDHQMFCNQYVYLCEKKSDLFVMVICLILSLYGIFIIELNYYAVASKEYGDHVAK